MTGRSREWVIRAESKRGGGKRQMNKRSMGISCRWDQGSERAIAARRVGNKQAGLMKMFKKLKCKNKISVRPVTNNGLQCKNWFCFDSNVIGVSHVLESMFIVFSFPNFVWLVDHTWEKTWNVIFLRLNSIVRWISLLFSIQHQQLVFYKSICLENRPQNVF